MSLKDIFKRVPTFRNMSHDSNLCIIRRMFADIDSEIIRLYCACIKLLPQGCGKFSR